MPAQSTGNSTSRLASPAEERIGEYRILEKAGSGGMATVWRVRGPSGKVHALKEMRPQSEARREMTRRFKQEFEVTSRLDHRNIVRVTDFFAAQETLHIVMEWIEGLDLRGVMKHAGLLDDGRLAALAADVSAGLASAHAAGVLHRDLKPENVMLDYRGRVKVADFGVARVTGTRLTATGIIVGSPAYMSPEQLAGVSGQKLTPASDIYALGVLLYELGEGKDPLGLKKHEDLLTVLRAKRDKKPRRMKLLKDEELRALILQCLEPEELDRPQSMEDVARRLRRIARRHGALRADLEHLAQTAIAGRDSGRKVRGEVAPFRPAPPAEEPVEQSPPSRTWFGRGPREPRVPARSAPAPAPPAPRAPAREPRSLPARAREPRVPPRQPRVPPRQPRAPARAPARASLPEPPARAPSRGAAWDGADPSWHDLDDFGGSDRHPSRVTELSVKRRSVYEEGSRVVARLALLIFGLTVVFLAASTSLTGSPLGLLELLVPMP